MELELGLKITRTREEVSSSVDFRFSKDPFGPLVLSRETDSRFIIIIHLKGFKKEGIEIEINKEGNRITIRGRKPVEEMVFIRWMAWRKEVELRVFKKVFLIPNIVDLDKIKARFDDDDSTLTITMPKRVKGISGFKIEEEEEEEEERVDFGDVSGVENREEIQNEELEDENVEREKSDEHSEKFETEFQREEFGEIIENKERESQVFEDEDETEDDNLEKIHQIDEQDKILEFVEEKKIGQQELADSNTESENSSLGKLPDIEDQENKQEVMEQQVSEVKSDDFGSRAFEEIEEQKPRELDKTKAEEFEFDKLEADEVDKVHELVEKKEEEEENARDGEQKFQGQKRHDKQEKIKELVEEQTPEAKKNTANDTPKPVQEIEVPEVDTLERCEGKHKIEKLFQEGTDNQREEHKEKVVKTGKKINDAGSRKVQEIRQEELDELVRCEKEIKTRGLVKSETNDEEKEKKEIAETETKEQESYRPKILEEQEISEKKTEFGGDDISRKVGDIQQRERRNEESKIQEMVEEKRVEEKKKIVKMEIKNGDSKEDVDAKMGEGFNIDRRKVVGEDDTAETDAKSEEFESEKIHEMVEKKEDEEEENAKVGQKSEEIKLQEESQKQHLNLKKAKDFESDKLKADEGEHKNQRKDYKEKIMETGKTINDSGAKMVQEIIRQQELDEPARCEKESKTRELVKNKRNDEEKEEKEIAETDTKEQESYRPKILEEQEKIQQLAEEKTKFSRKVEEEEEIAEKKTEFGGDDISRKVGDIKQLIGGEISGCGEVEDVENEKKTTETDKRIRDSAREVQENEKKDSNVSEKYGKEDMVQELQENRATYRNEHEEEKKDKGDKPQKKIGTIEQELVYLNSQLEQDNIQERNKTQELLEEKAKDCEEEESETKTDDVVRKVQGNKDQELHEPKIHKERDKTRLTGAEEPSGQEKEEEEEEKIVESMTITENDNNSIDVQEMKEERPVKPESHEKQYKIQEVVEAGHNGHKEEEQQEKVISKQETEIENDELKRPMVQDKMQETWEKDKTRAMEENEIVERRTKTKDGSLRKVLDDGDPGLSKPYKRQEEDKIQELVEMGTSDYREKIKKQDGNDILRSQEAGRPDLNEFERHGEQSNFPQLVEEEKMENIAEPGGKLEDDNSDKFHEFEERKSYEDWTHEEREKRKDLVKEEATDPKGKHTGGEGHNDDKEEKVIAKADLEIEEDSSKKVQEIEKQEYDELHRSIVQDKMQETEEKDKTRAMEENKIVERSTKTKDVSLRKVQEGEDPDLGRHQRHGKEETGKMDLGELERQCKQTKIQQSVEDEKGEGKLENISEPCGKMEGDSSDKFHEFQKQESYEDWRQEESEEIENLVKEEATDDPKDKHTGEEKERYEKVAQAKTKVEDEINKKAGEYKEPESDKQERFGKLDKLKGVLREGASDHEKEEENLVDDFTTTTQETEKEESREADRHKKLDIVQDFVEDETGNQKDEKPEEAAALMANNEKDSSRKLQTLKGQELKEPEEHKEQNKIPETNDPEVKEVEEERVAEKEIKEQEAHVQELEGKTENCKDDDEEGRRGEKGKRRKTVETKSDDRIVRKIRETKVQESNKKKDQEPEDKIEELERKEPVKLVTEDDQEFLEKESNVSKRRPVEQEKIQELKEVEKREDEENAEVETKIDDGISRKFETSKMLELDESEENEELKKIREPMEGKSKVLEKENEKIAEEKIQDKIDSRMEDQEIKRQEPYELHKNGEHDKIPELIVERTKYHREEEKGMGEREIEETKRIAENVSSRKSIQMKDELEKHQKPSEIPEKSNIQESVEQTIQEHGYKTPPKKKSMEDSRQYQDVEEKRSDQEQEKIQELIVEEEEIEKGEQKEKTERIPQVEPKANDDSSRKSEFEEQESTRLREQKKRIKHQELVERETSDQRKEEKKDVGKAKTEAEYDRSCKIQDNEEEKSDKLEKLGETSNRKEGKEGNRAVWGEGETKTRDDGCRKVKEIEEQELVVTQKEQEKKQALVKKDTLGQAKEKKDQETKNIDDSSRNVKEDEKQESDEHKRNEEQGKNMGPVREKINVCRNQESGKGDKEITDANGSRKLKEIEERESTEVEKHESSDIIQEFGEENMINQEKEDNKSIIKDVEAKPEDHESKRPVVLKGQDKTREPVQQKTDNCKDEETAKTETKIKDSESSKMQEMTSEQMRLKEQERIKKMVEDRTSNIVEEENRETEFEDGTSKKIQEREKEESTEPGRDEKRDKIQEPVDMETSEEEEKEELEVEFEDSEEDWEADIIQEMDSDEDNDKIRQIKRIKLGFRLVGGSALFMSLIVIVISFIRSKKKLRCYKF